MTLDDFYSDLFKALDNRASLFVWEDEDLFFAFITNKRFGGITLTVPKDWNNLWPLRCKRAVEETLELLEKGPALEALFD